MENKGFFSPIALFYELVFGSFIYGTLLWKGALRGSA